MTCRISRFRNFWNFR